MRENDNIVVLDADLRLDTGLVEVHKAFPDRFIECGIAEQDMVSTLNVGIDGQDTHCPFIRLFSILPTKRTNL